MFKMDFYSETIKCIHERFRNNGLQSLSDDDALLDYTIICNASMTAMDDEAKQLATELIEIYKIEILDRMSRYRRQASAAAENVYTSLIGFEDNYYL